MVSGAGKRKWVRSLCSAVFGGRAPAKLRGTVQDVTQRRDLEESMRMANLIYQTSLEAIVVTDEANRIVDANPAFTRRPATTLGEVLGTTPRLFASSMHDAASTSACGRRCWNDHWQGEIQDRNKDGSLHGQVRRHPRDPPSGRPRATATWSSSTTSASKSRRTS
jgi:PAS domain S-box-containing protein